MNIKFSFLLFGIVLGLFTPFNVESDKNDFCTDLIYLMEQSESQFSEIKDQERDGNKLQLIFADAEDCRFSLGLNSSSYQCFWKYDLGSEQAVTQLELLRKETKKCIGHLYAEESDDSVNHPDFYLAYFYVFPNGQVNIALKDKSVTMNTYVSVRVDALK